MALIERIMNTPIDSFAVRMHKTPKPYELSFLNFEQRFFTR